jgi:hypothetical protein
MGDDHDTHPEYYNQSKEFSKSSDIHPPWKTGVFIGTANIGFNTCFIFISSKNNDERRLLEPGAHSTIFAAQCPREHPPHFEQGVPYWLQSNGAPYAFAPDGAPVFMVTGLPHDIKPFHNEENTPSPVIRCSLVGPRGKYLRFKPTETHSLRIFNDLAFSIFKDQHTVAAHGDYLLRVRARRCSTGLFPCVDRSGGICATLSRGDASRVIARDAPPSEFVRSVCVVRKAYLTIGCEDQPRIPTISPGDLLLAGGTENIKSREQVIDFISAILSSKYLNASRDGPLRVGDDWTKIYKRVNQIISENRIYKNHCTLLWAREGEGLNIREARRICLLLQGEDFSPQLIAPCNGATVFAANANFFDVNPAIFPSNEFGFVSPVSGCVNVTNVLPNGRFSNIGSANVVRFAIGTTAVDPVEPWEAAKMFPELLPDTVVDGVSPDGLLTDPDTESEDVSDPLSSRLVVCQKKGAPELKGILKSRQYVKTCELLRSTGGARWSTFLTLPSGIKTEEMDLLLRSRHFF